MDKILKNLLGLAGKGVETQLCERRKDALQRAEALGIPPYGSEAYQRTDLPSILSAPWGKVDARLELKHQDNLPDGVYFGLASEATISLPILESAQGDFLAQVAEAMDHKALLLHVSKGVQVEEAIELEHNLKAWADALEVCQLFVVVEAGASVEIIRRDRNETFAPSVSLQGVQITLGEGAKLRYVDIEESKAVARRISTLHLHQEGGSEANINFFTLQAGKTRNNYHCTLAGEHASLSLGGAVVAKGKEHVDNYSFISHSVPHCTSNELFKYLLQDESYGVFTGKILVAVDAQKTQAYQNNRNLLLSPSARMQAKPQLEIYADDVKCSHGMTTGQLNADALFYMRQRGIALEEAKRMLAIAFTDDVIALVDNESLREELSSAFATRL